MTYATHRDQMQTGDVIAFSGKGTVSELIKRVQWVKRSEDYNVSHVGFVYVGWVNEQHKCVFLVESTTLSNVPTVDPDTLKTTKEKRAGIQMVLLSQRLELYDGDVWWQPIKADRRNEIPIDSWTRANDELFQWLRERRPYDTIQAIGAALDFWDSIGFGNDPDFSALFCSESVSRYHQNLELHSGDANPSDLLPADVCGCAFLNEPVPLKVEA